MPLFSSAALEVLIDQPCHLITIPAGGRLNCGRCEKCQRTKLNLLVLGLPIRSQTFADVA